MRTLLALCLGLLVGATALAPAPADAHPVQIPGCPSVSFFHGAKKPNRVGPQDDRVTWLTWPNNALSTPKTSYTLEELAKRLKQKPDELKKNICGDSGTNCASRLVAMGNDGFADTHALVIPVTTRSGATARYFLLETVCVDWEKERVATSCEVSDVSANLVSVHYTMSGGEDDDDLLMWEQLFNKQTGALLLTSESPDRLGKTTPIRVEKSGAVAIEGCGQWAAGEVREGKKPTMAANSRTVTSLIASGRKATKQANYPAAVKAFTDAITIEPAAVKAWSGRGFAHLRAGQPKLALKDFQHVLQTYRTRMDKKTIAMIEHNIELAQKAIASQ